MPEVDGSSNVSTFQPDALCMMKPYSRRRLFYQSLASKPRNCCSHARHEQVKKIAFHSSQCIGSHRALSLLSTPRSISRKAIIAVITSTVLAQTGKCLRPRSLVGHRLKSLRPNISQHFMHNCTRFKHVPIAVARLERHDSAMRETNGRTK